MQNDFVQLDILAKKLNREENLGFLMILDGNGEVVLRANASSQKGENLSREKEVSSSLLGESYVTINTSAAEGFSIRAASPIRTEEEVVGVIVTGFPLDNVFVDSIKNITGLEASIFESDTQVATTLFNPDGRTRSVGIKQTDEQVLKSVLENGNGLTLRTSMLSRPFVASYLPLTDADGNTVGMLAALKPQAEILETAQATNRITLIVVMVIMLILIVPIYGITKRLSAELH